MYPHKKSLTPNAQALRRGMTPEERHFWYDFLKRLPLTIHRQKVIGPYIVDFYIAERRIAIELDGRQHTTPEHRAKDEVRDCALKELGITVLRYRNEDIRKAFEGVLRDVLFHLDLTLADLT